MFRRFVSTVRSRLSFTTAAKGKYYHHQQQIRYLSSLSHQYKFHSGQFVICPAAVVALQDDDNDNGNNDNNDNTNNSNNININNINLRTYRRKRNYDSTFLNKPKPSNSDDPNDEQQDEPPKKKRKYAKRTSLDGPTKASIIRYAIVNPTATAADIITYFKLKCGERTVQKLKQHAHEWKEEDIAALEDDKRKRKRKRISLFPTIEKALCDARDQRVSLQRDRSKEWMKGEGQRLLNDENRLKELNLTKYEKDHIDEFKCSEGFIDKVIKRNDFGLQSTHSDRKLTVEQYAVQRVTYLAKERKVWHESGLIIDDEIDEGRFVNGDEVPLVLTKKDPKQISKKGERVQLRAPPISDHNKYRDSTLIPFITNEDILFCVVILKGGPTIQRDVVPKLNAKYKDLLIFANPKGFLTNSIWKESMKKLEDKSRPLRGCDFFRRKPQKNLMFYSDNCTMHSTVQARGIYKRLWKIIERQLIPNATHVQQPVDQHFGHFIQQFIANKYWLFGESILDEIDAGKRGEKETVGIAVKREKICEWTAEAVKAARKKPNLFKHAWINFGLYLPLNGEQDGDISTIDTKKKK